MRIGQNPAKTIDQVPQPQKVTVALVSYIPFLSGYYAQSLDVLKVCLESLWENTDLPYDLIVFDNASCQEVRQHLIHARNQGKIQYLLLSDRNVGKGGAWNFIFGAAPGEFVAYADSDVYFYPGWLSAALEVFEHLPGTGMLTGMPLLNPEQYSTSTIAWADQHPDVLLERGQLLSWEDYWRHAGTLGNDEEKARQFYHSNQSLRLTYRQRSYYVGAGHFQFVAPASVLRKALPIPSRRPMGQVRSLDEAINRLGYLRLSTTGWWVQHLGNTLSGFDGTAQPHPATPPVEQMPSGSRPSLWTRGPFRKALLWLYDRIFKLLHQS